MFYLKKPLYYKCILKFFINLLKNPARFELDFSFFFLSEIGPYLFLANMVAKRIRRRLPCSSNLWSSPKSSLYLMSSQSL